MLRAARMEVAPTSDGGTTLTLTSREVMLLRTALERALFLDTPPHVQGATMDLAEELLRMLGESGLNQE